jgi:hypothetical protein
MVRRTPSNLVLVVWEEIPTPLPVLFICMCLSFEFQIYRSYCISACNNKPRLLRAHRDRNDTLFTGSRPSIAEKQMKWGQRTKLDKLVLHKARLA